MTNTVSLGQMVNLALGTPEVGSVNFNVLHSLLHAVIKKLDIADAKAEITDFERDFLKSQKAKNGTNAIDEDSAIGSTIGEDIDSASAKGSFPGFSKSPYHQLQDKVSTIQKTLDDFNQLPNTEQLLKQSNGNQSGDRQMPVNDMWQSMQLKKRVDANEDGVSKLMQMMDDMMKEMEKLKDENKDLKNRLGNLNLDELEEKLNKKLKELEDLTNQLNDKFSLFPDPKEFENYVTWPGLEDALKGLRTDLAPKDRVVIEMAQQTEVVKTVSRPVSARPLSAQSVGPSEELAKILEKIGKLTDKHDILEERVDNIEDQLKNKLDREELNEAMKSLSLPDDLLNQLKQFKDELDKLNKAREKDSDAISRAQEAILNLQAEIEKLNQITQNLTEENDNRRKDIQNLYSTTSRLDEVKADKEFVQQEVEPKADKKHLDNKVNRNTFDSTCNDINRMINEILEKLNGNEGWKEALGQLQNDLDGKLDRLELDPLREWLESRLKALAGKIKQHSTWSDAEDEAAGLRKQLVQKFNCISCDRKVEMMPNQPTSSLPAQNGLPATRSTRPYTTFELDQIRQHGRSLSGPNEVVDVYATKRACGGAHTLTYPNRRTNKVQPSVGGFFEEEVVAPAAPAYTPPYKQELDLQGVDGHIYKGRISARLPTVHTAPGGEPQVRGRQSRSPPRSQSVRPPASPRPGSARQPAGRPGSARVTSRPQSARPGSTRDSPPPGDDRPAPDHPGTPEDLTQPPARSPSPVNVDTQQ
ncbi:unnamed protein product [Owenia fusiformis]|uniref:Uncharacterized protein n=1 Tax=Owenia fusiformis TaxID=6347 RepID=A0A8J1UQA3_OWEFU|nr:unnamed protein product [Owenia fusiformis]